MTEDYKVNTVNNTIYFIGEVTPNSINTYYNDKDGNLVGFSKSITNDLVSTVLS